MWVALGSALGGAGRYWLVWWIDRQIVAAFPWGTLGVNFLGSAAIGLVAVVAADTRLGVSELTAQTLMIGVLGGFTTFSAFSLQTVQLLQSGAQLTALAYVAASVLLCLIGVLCGSLTGDLLMRHII
jgi:CrcB protein